MADIYIRSTDGDDLDTGATWALAKATFAGADAIDAAGDRWLVSQAHTETVAINTTFSFAGTLTAPSLLLGVNDAAEPPTAILAGGRVAVSGIGALFLNGNLYADSIEFVATGGAVNATLKFNTGVGNIKQTFKNCKFAVDATGSAAGTTFGTAANIAANQVDLEDCTFLSANTGTSLVGLISLKFTWKGGSVLPGTNSPSIFNLASAGEGIEALVDGVDFSLMSAAMDIIRTSVGQSGSMVLRNCKLPASWTGSMFTTRPVGFRGEMYNCDSADTNYKLLISDAAGDIRDESAIYRDSGAGGSSSLFSGATELLGLSWKMVSTAEANYPNIPLRSPEFMLWNDVVGTPVTIRVEVVHDSQGAGTGGGFRNDGLWLDAQYLGTSGSPLSVIANSAPTSVLAAAVDLPDSAVTWTGTGGMTTPVKEYLTLTFTPQERGYIKARVNLALASKTVYVDPMMTKT